MTRLIGRWQQDRTIKRKPVKRPRFPYLFGQADVVLLASTDVAHQDLSGPALCRILKREYEVFGNQCYQRLSGISVSHLYITSTCAKWLKATTEVETGAAIEIVKTVEIGHIFKLGYKYSKASACWMKAVRK